MSNPLGPLYSFDFLLLLVCAILYYKLADLDEDASGLVWAGLSVFTFVLTWLVLGWGMAGDLLGQVALLGGIAAFRAMQDRDRS